MCTCNSCLVHCTSQVLSDGLVKEFDTPYHLLQDSNSLFAEMVEQTGPITARELRQMVIKTDSGLINGEGGDLV